MWKHGSRAGSAVTNDTITVYKHRVCVMGVPRRHCLTQHRYNLSSSKADRDADGASSITGAGQ